MPTQLEADFGNLDIYLFDQLLRGNITPHMRVLDAGCGGGRNLIYLLRQGCEVFATDANSAAVEHVRNLVATLNPHIPPQNFKVGDLEHLDFPDSFTDVVLCSAVLHFARDRRHFEAIVSELWRVLRPCGLLFIRLGTCIGMDFPPVAPDLYRMPDGETWFLLTEADLTGYTACLGATLIDPLKTTIVQNQRSMTTWVLRKQQGHERCE